MAELKRQLNEWFEHNAQAAPTAQTSATASPTPGAAAPRTAPPVAPATTPTVADPVHDVIADTPVDLDAPTPAPIDTEAEATLSAEITKLLTDRKNGNASVRRTRAEMRSLRLTLAEKLHSMKALLARTGRGSGWAKYLRLQHLPVTTADRYVAQHEASLAPPAEKDPTGELPTPTVDEVRQLAKNMLPKVSRLLSTQELVYEFFHTLIWGIDVAEMSYTDAGFEIPKVASDDAPEVDAPAAESASPAPAVQ